jgi:nucleotide-binding universal stress UspA family protein
MGLIPISAHGIAMSYATLMVYVNVDRVSKALVSVGADLADKFSAKLIGLSALAIVPPVVAEGVVVVDHASEPEIAQMKKSLAEAGENFRAAAGAKRETEWRSALEIPTDTLIRQARCADLVIIGKSGRSIDFYKAPDPGMAIMEAGRPFLVVPSGVKTLAADHVVIGWKDTREARRAIQDALPLLRQAKRVTVIEICASDQQEAARHQIDDVVLYLARHKVRAEGRVETRLLGSGADQIIGFAEEEGADLLVTGAYGHSRLNEWIFGGMTRDLLTSSPICCLMSH